MHIIHIASELAPLAKVGGLADVLLGLCRELSWKGHDVDIIIPKYDCINSDEIRDMSIVQNNLMSYYAGEWYSNTIWTGWVENLRVYFIDPHHPRHFFSRGCFYGCQDDIERYLYFARAAIEFLFKQSIRPKIIHLHDWQTGIIPVLYADIYKEKGFGEVRFVSTVHNMEYQGKCAVADLDRIGLKGENYLTEDKLQDPLNPELVNLLKAGIVYSDFVTTVSPTYAEEVKTPEFGCGLDRVIVKHQNKFMGILNGLDYSYWNPEIDRHLPIHYSSREIPANKKDRNTLDKKAYIKRVLREKLSLTEDYSPVVGNVTRLVPQKGIELLKGAISHTLSKGGQFIMLGSPSTEVISEEFQALKNHYSGNPHVSLMLQHQEELAHLIFAASDIFLVPSIFEPCGLTQMIALKYGAIPIVRRTGGLADTVFDVDTSGKEGNGYTFDPPEMTAFASTMDRAFECWFKDPDRWRTMMINGMNIDYSWNKASNQYLEVYNKLNVIV